MVRRAGSTQYVDRYRWRRMVLKEHVIFKSDMSDTNENRGPHHMICVAPKSIDDIMIIPDIHLRDLPISRRKWLRGEPPTIIPKEIIIAVLSALVIERVDSSLAGILFFCPMAQRPFNPNAIIVDLISPTNH